MSVIYTRLQHSPVPDRALIGKAHILAYLHRMGIRRMNGAPLSWRMVVRWRREFDCPIIRGSRAAHCKTPAFSSEHALLSWLCGTTFTTGLCCPFRVDTDAVLRRPGSSPATHNAETQAQRGLAR